VNKTEIINNPPAARFTPQKKRKRNRVMKTKTSRKAGFTLVEIMIVVAIIGLLAAIAIPNFVKARSTAQMNACINNLRQIDSAKQQWALERGQQSSATPVESDIAVYIGRAGTATAVASTVYCPVDTGKSFATSYNVLACSVAPTCIGMGTDPNYKHALPN
jgi:prepilin-type N-terminal cleavage/methylation domain-containing protein